jgi:hypothetical protein
VQIAGFRGGVAVTAIDHDDIAMVTQFNWHLEHDGYVATRVANKRLALHRHILGATPESPIVDHINRNTLDNRRSNLRFADARTNAANRGKKRGLCLSQYKGVTWHPRAGKWQASCDNKYIGVFTSEEDAARAYDARALLVFGAFAYQNFDERSRSTAEASR